MAKFRRARKPAAGKSLVAFTAGGCLLLFNKEIVEAGRAVLGMGNTLLAANPKLQTSHIWQPAVSSLISITVAAVTVTAIAAAIRGFVRGTRKARHRKRLLANATNANFIATLGWREFEMLVGQVFRERGYRVEEGAGTQDGGIDLTLSKRGRQLLVQCKHWKATSVGVAAVRELAGVVQLNKAQGGVLVCSGRFTNKARQEAKKLDITLISGGDLARHIHAIFERRS